MINIILLIAVFLYLIFRQRRLFLYRKYELALFRLRDKLRDLAIEGKIDADDWTFHYLDSSFSKMTNRFKMLNIFHAIYLRNQHINDTKIIAFGKHLNLELSKNESLKQVYTEYNKILSSYMVEKHIVMFSVGAVAVYTYIKSKSKIAAMTFNAKESIQNLTILPETSTSEDFIKNYRPVYAQC